MKNSQLFKQARLLKIESRDATKLDFTDDLSLDPNDALQGYNLYRCNDCWTDFKSHYEGITCPVCYSFNIEYEGYSNILYLQKETAK